MNLVLFSGVITVNLALAAYTVATWRLQLRPLSHQTLIILSAGVFFDIVATLCMITGSPNSPFTFHGIMGYSALLAMLIDAALLWKRLNATATLSPSLRTYSKLAYGWWVMAYVTGVILVAGARSAGA